MIMDQAIKRKGQIHYRDSNLNIENGMKALTLQAVYQFSQSPSLTKYKNDMQIRELKQVPHWNFFHKLLIIALLEKVRKCEKVVKPLICWMEPT